MAQPEDRRGISMITTEGAIKAADAAFENQVSMLFKILCDNIVGSVDDPYGKFFRGYNVALEAHDQVIKRIKT